MDLKQMALDAGGDPLTNDEAPDGGLTGFDDASLQRFAQAVAEECAKACEAEKLMGGPLTRDGVSYHFAIEHCAYAIRNLFREQV